MSQPRDEIFALISVDGVTAPSPADKRARNRSRWLPILFLVICGAVELLLAPLETLLWRTGFPGDRVPWLRHAAVSAQLAAVGVWLAWSCQPFWKRLAVHWSIVALLAILWLAGQLAWQFLNAQPLIDVVSHPEMWSGIMMLPCLAIVTQVPAWIARLLVAARLVNTGHSESYVRRPLSIADLLACMTVVAVTTLSLRETTAWVIFGRHFDRGSLIVTVFNTTLAACLSAAMAGAVLGAATRRAASLWGTASCVVAVAAPLLVLMFGLGWPLIEGTWLFAPYIATIVVLQLLLAVAARLAGYRVIAGWKPTSPDGGSSSRVPTSR